MNKKIKKIAIFGRTNVGKSTLFNCLTEKTHALVSGIPGTTRDRNTNFFEWRGVTMELIDTGGIIDLKLLKESKRKKITADTEAEEIDLKVQRQAREIINDVDLIFFIVDAQTGILPQDKAMASYIAKNKKLKDKTVIVANKADNPRVRNQTAVFNKLSLGAPLAISATTGSGTGDLLDFAFKKLKVKTKKYEEKEAEKEAEIKVAIIGKPNVGKSSLLNSILGYDRVIVSQAPHTTREPQDTVMKYKDKKIRLIDTAGISRKSTKAKGLEKYGVAKSLAILKKADIAFLVLDINEGITHQDMKLVQEIIDRNTSFAVIANKWDLVEDRDIKYWTNYIYNNFPFCKWTPIQFLSAKTGNKVGKVMDFILFLHEERTRPIISDSVMNKFLGRIVKKHKPVKGHGTKYPRIYELKMTETNPPCFKIRIGPGDTLADSYVRFIENQIRAKFGFQGTPINMYVIKKRDTHGKHEETPSDNKLSKIGK